MRRSHRWRLLLDGPADGHRNMGIDEVLLCSAAQREIATLRLYTWSGYWLSLGYPQTFHRDQHERCLAAGVGVVRRATGGKAVLHGGDLTYSVASPEWALPAGLRGSYDLVARALEAAFRKLGVDVQRTAPAAAGPARGVFDCFAHAAGDEICARGLKLAGSAQRRVAGALLQHGSIRLSPEPRAVALATGLAGAGATSLREEGWRGSESELRLCLQETFRDELDLCDVPDSLDDAERAMLQLRLDRRSVAPLSLPPLLDQKCQ